MMTHIFRSRFYNSTPVIKQSILLNMWKNLPEHIKCHRTAEILKFFSKYHAPQTVDKIQFNLFIEGHSANLVKLR